MRHLCRISLAAMIFAATAAGVYAQDPSQDAASAQPAPVVTAAPETPPAPPPAPAEQPAAAPENAPSSEPAPALEPPPAPPVQAPPVAAAPVEPSREKVVTEKKKTTRVTQSKDKAKPQETAPVVEQPQAADPAAAAAGTAAAGAAGNNNPPPPEGPAPPPAVENPAPPPPPMEAGDIVQQEGAGRDQDERRRLQRLDRGRHRRHRRSRHLPVDVAPAQGREPLDLRPRHPHGAHGHGALDLGDHQDAASDGPADHAPTLSKTPNTFRQGGETRPFFCPAAQRSVRFGGPSRGGTRAIDPPPRRARSGRSRTGYSTISRALSPAGPAGERRQTRGLRGENELPRLPDEGVAVSVAGTAVAQPVLGPGVLATPRPSAPDSRGEQLSHLLPPGKECTPGSDT